MKKIVLPGLALLLLLNIGLRAQMVSWPLTSDGHPEVIAAQLAADSLRKGPAIQYTQSEAIGFTDDGATLKYWPEDTLQAGKYFQVAVAPVSGYDLVVDSLHFGERRSGTGPRRIQLRHGTDTALAASQLWQEFFIPDNTDERQHAVGELPGRILSGDTLFIRWYAYRSENSTFGSWRLNDHSVKLFGNAPEAMPQAKAEQVKHFSRFLQQGTDSNQVYGFLLEAINQDIQLQNVSFRIRGNVGSAAIDSLCFWYSPDTVLNTQAALLNVNKSVSGPGSYSFTNVNETITAGDTGHFFVSAAINTQADSGRFVQFDTLSRTDLQFSDSVALRNPMPLFPGDTLYIIPRLSELSDLTIPASYTFPRQIPYIQHLEDFPADTGFGIAQLRLRDGGTLADADNQPTALKYLTLYVNTPEALKKVLVTHADTLVSQTLATDSLLTVPVHGLAANDDDSTDFRMHAIFNESVTDQKPVYWEVRQVQTLQPGSELASSHDAGIAADTSNGQMRLQVVADRLRFRTPPPPWLHLDSTFQCRVQAVDRLHNRDRDVNETVQLNALPANHVFTDEMAPEASMKEGHAFFTNAGFEKSGHHQLWPFGAGLPPEDSAGIAVLTPLSYEPFIDTNLVENPVWAGDLEYFYVENGMLQSQGPQEASNRIVLSTLQDTFAAQEWRFRFKLDFNPTSYNFLRYFPAMDTLHPDSASAGYFLHIGETSADYLRFYRFDSTGTHELLADTVSYSDEIALKIRLTRSPQGLWKLYSALPEAASYRFVGEVQDAGVSTGLFTGLLAAYKTASRADQYAFDAIASTPLTDTTASVEILTEGTAQQIPTTSNMPDKAVTAAQFRFKDRPVHDTLPLFIDSLLITPGTGNAFGDWTQAIAGAQLRIPNDTLTGSIMPDGIRFIPPESVRVPAGDSLDAALWLWLQDTLDNPDGKHLHLALKSRNVFTGFPGSSLAANKVTTDSTRLEVAVEASRLKLQHAPAIFQRNKPFTLQVTATDENGHPDHDATDSVQVDVQQHASLVTGSLHGQLLAGTITFDSLRYDSLGYLPVQANADGLAASPPDTLLVQGDTTTLVLPALPALPPDTIFSVADTRGEAVPLMRFHIADQGSGDEVPTEVRTLQLQNPLAENPPEWDHLLAGMRLFLDSTEIYPAEVLLEEHAAILMFSPGDFQVSDGDTALVEIRAWLQDEDIPDSTFLQVQAFPNPEVWRGPLFKSSFKPAADTLKSGRHMVDVQATTMEFTEIPQHVGVDSPFAIELKATDANGNRDRQTRSSIGLSLGEGEGQLSSTDTSFSQGLATIQPLRYDTFGRFAIRVEPGDSLISPVVSPYVQAGDFNSALLASGESLHFDTLQATDVTPEEARPLLSLNIRDSASTDGMPTVIEEIHLKNAHPDQEADWTEVLGGAFVVLNGDTLMPDEVDMGTDALQLVFETEPLTVPDGELRILQVLVYLNPGRVIDQSNLQAMLDRSHEWETIQASSGLAQTMPADVYGPVMHLQVQADALKLAGLPGVVSNGEAFEAEVHAVDSLGNRDANAQAMIVLKALSNGHELFARTAALQEGKVLFGNLDVSAVGSFRLVATPEITGYLPDTSSAIPVGGRRYQWFYHDFEAIEALTWEDTANWTRSAVAPAVGAYSLRHGLVDASGRSILSRPLSIDSLRTGAVSWQFVLKNGDWSPSSSNYFYYSLLSGNESLYTDEGLSFTLGVNVSGNDDRIKLLASDSTGIQILIDTGMEWTANELRAVKVIRMPDGTWKLYVSEANQPDHLVYAGEASHSGLPEQARTGVVFQHSSPSRAGQLWLDNMGMNRLNMPPHLQEVEVLEENLLRVRFTEPPLLADASHPSRYEIRKGDSLYAVSAVTTSGPDERTYLLEVDLPANGTYTLIARNIHDAEGMLQEADSLHFFYALQPAANEVVITEIMHDPTPSQGLPEVEYLELFNRFTREVLTQDWILQAGDNTATFPVDTLLSEGYALICSREDSAALAAYGNVIGLEAFPGLVNSGERLKLFNADGMLLNEVHYSEDWETAPDSINGGVALEKIDPANNCSGKLNWGSSTHPQGGTPGQRNALDAPNTDQEAPALESLAIIQAQELELAFSEPLNPASVLAPEAFGFTTASLRVTQVTKEDDPARIRLRLSAPMQNETSYTLRITGIADVCGNIAADTLVALTYYRPGMFDVVINELMPDPEPPVALPDAEYVELHNNTDYPVDLRGFRIAVNGEKAPIPAATLPPAGYLALFDHKTIEAVPDTIPAIFMKLPALTNSEGVVTLYADSSRLMDVVAYQDDWISSGFKREGGWALERLDPTNPREGAPNWAPATRPSGGTPGMPNSVAQEFPDVVRPEFIQSFVEDSLNLRLNFSEALDTTLLHPDCFSIDHDLGVPQSVEAKHPLHDKLNLQLKQPMQKGMLYALPLCANLADYSGNTINEPAVVQFGLPAKALQGDVLINEVLFNPLPGGADFVELYNHASYPLDLGQLFLATRNDSGLLAGPQQIAPQGRLLLPGAYVAVTEDPEIVRTHYPEAQDHDVLRIADLPSLSNDKGYIAVTSRQGTVLDALSYHEDMHNPLLVSHDGVSLERTHFSFASGDPDTWQSAAEEAGFATPGYKNSQFYNPEAIEDPVQIEPEVFSPDQDGYKDLAFIRYQFDDTGYNGTVRIYDAGGRLIQQIAENKLLGTKGVFTWDGTNRYGEYCRTGIYVVFFQVFNQEGTVNAWKKTVVLGKHRR